MHFIPLRVASIEKRGNKSAAWGANARLQLLLENFQSKKGHYYVKNALRVICPTCMCSPFDSKQQVWVSSKYLQ